MLSWTFPRSTFVLHQCLTTATYTQETTKLDFGRDASGATVINQYVVVKTLGRGAFGKVKLCLNTLNGQLYAVKVGRAPLGTGCCRRRGMGK